MRTILTLVLLSAAIRIFAADDVVLTFAAVADCQYCDQPEGKTRKYRLSPQKLQDCVNDINKKDVDFSVHLGDFIDRDWASFDVVEPIWAQLTKPSYHVLGNHEFSVADDKKPLVYKRLNMPAPYYDFMIKGWQFLVVDGNDISFQRYAKGSPEYKVVEQYFLDKQIKSPRWNGAIGPEQMAWIEKKLTEADKVKQPVILFCHFPVYPKNNHNLWNDSEVIECLERHPSVRAWINGHNHAGGYGLKNNIHYLTMHGMVEQKETAYGFLKISEKSITCDGVGREPQRQMIIER